MRTAQTPEEVVEAAFDALRPAKEHSYFGLDQLADD